MYLMQVPGFAERGVPQHFAGRRKGRCLIFQGKIIQIAAWWKLGCKACSLQKWLPSLGNDSMIGSTLWPKHLFQSCSWITSTNTGWTDSQCCKVKFICWKVKFNSLLPGSDLISTLGLRKIHFASLASSFRGFLVAFLFVYHFKFRTSKINSNYVCSYPANLLPKLAMFCINGGRWVVHGGKTGCTSSVGLDGWVSSYERFRLLADKWI